MNNAPKTFPSDYIEALTMLYLERQDLSGKTPEEFVELYTKTYSRISGAASEAIKAARTESRK